MRRFMLFLCLLGSVTPALPNPRQEHAGEQPGQTHFIRTQADAVLLDIVVRDSKGRPVSDLRPQEVRVLEDGVEQDVRLFRLRKQVLATRAPLEAEEPEGRADGVPAIARTESAEAIDPFRYLNLVSLVFDRLSLEGRRFSRQGALDFLDAGIDENTLVAAFVIDQRLEIVQPFTRNTELLRAAVERATAEGYSMFASNSDAIQETLQEMTGASNSGSAAVAGIGRGNTPSGDIGGGFADQAIAQMTLNMLQKFQELAREQQGMASVYGLLALVGEQKALAGRKTLLYFSEGLHVPPNLEERFRFTISEANQANVSIYSVDAKGLDSESLMGEAKLVLGGATRASRNQLLFGLGKAVTREQVLVFEKAETSLRLNRQGTLADLAEGTGGFMIANTNDLRPSMRRLQEDLHVYYEIAYIPRSPLYDGSFRQITVEIDRPDVHVQARNGYFAMPPTASEGPPVFPYEVPLLAACASSALPQDLDFRFRMLRFRSKLNQTQLSMVAEVPLSNFTFKKRGDSYSTRFSLLALVKDQDGKIVRKVSQDYPLEGPADKVESLLASEIIFIRQIELPPGRYRVEVAAHDRESNRVGARRSFLLVAAKPEGVEISSLSVIRRIDPVEASANDAENPFLVESGKIIPDLQGRIQAESGGNLGIFMLLYPSRSTTEKPVLSLEVSKDGQAVGSVLLDLPSPNQDGEIPYVATLPVSGLEPGRYEVRAVARQGGASAEEHVFFTVN